MLTHISSSLGFHTADLLSIAMAGMYTTLHDWFGVSGTTLVASKLFSDMTYTNAVHIP